MTRSQVLNQINSEFATALHARHAGNEGMVRVCARRAAGVAIAFWLERNPRQGWGLDAMNQLKKLQLNETMPKEIRDAALRLTTKVNQQFTTPFSTDPVEDSKIIVNHLLE